MKTLYVSDLDGTLLRSNERTSDFTNETINLLTQQGILFSYATARSAITSAIVTQGMDAKIPIIVYNGGFVIDNQTGEILLANYFDNQAPDMIREMLDAGLYPIVYSFIDGQEKFSYIEELSHQGLRDFVATRSDHRKNPVHTKEELLKGQSFYMVAIDEPEKLYPFYQKYKDIYHCVYAKDTYSDNQWLEIMPPKATKAHAIIQLKEKLCCDRVVAFGDGINDIEMFQLADECYAVSNAHESLKQIATAVIPSNNEDGVAHWLRDHLLSN